MTNEDFFKTLDRLVVAWCERRALRPLRFVLQAYPLANGLTDDWHLLYESLRDVRAFCREELTEPEQIEIGKLIVLIQQTLENR